MCEPLKEFFKQPGRTQLQLAEHCGRRQATVSRWVSGQNPIPEASLPAVAEFTGIPPATLRPDLAKLFLQPAPQIGCSVDRV